MALNRDKYRKIVGGITTAEVEEPPSAAVSPPETTHEKKPLPAGQGMEPTVGNDSAEGARSDETRRFAKRGRPKGSKVDGNAGKGKKVKVSLFLSEVLVNDLYDWAHHDRIHPGEMFERALKPFHEREAKRRNGGKE